MHRDFIRCTKILNSLLNRKLDAYVNREEEAKAARIAMEIERNPSSQARSALENGDNEEDLYAAVHRGSTTESDEKYVPPPMKRKNSQHHRVGGGGSGGPGIGGSNRANYPTNGNSIINFKLYNSCTLFMDCRNSHIRAYNVEYVRDLY